MSILEWIKQLPSGVLGMVAAAFIYFTLSCLIRVKEKWWCRLLCLIGCWVASFTIIFIGDLVNLLCSIVFFLLIIWITCKGSLLKKITMGLILASSIFAFNAFYDNGLAFLAHYYGKDEFYGNMYLVGRLSFAVFLYLMIRFRRPEGEFELSPPLWRLMLMLTLTPLAILASVILLRSPYADISGTVIADSVLFLVVMLSFVGLLRALIVLERQQRLERENTLVLMNQKYYESMEQQQFEIRRLRHDLANHLQALLALPEQQREEYIKGMLDNPALIQVFSWCGDPTVNAVLTNKESLMQQRKVRFSARLDIEEELPFEKVDICAIFANALDNAVEACMKLDEQLREIDLEARLGKGILAVNIKNACKNEYGEENVERRTRLPQTTKKDSENHGFGLKSIQKTVKKYGGSMEIKRETQSFNLFLYLPVEKPVFETLKG